MTVQRVTERERVEAAWRILETLEHQRLTSVRCMTAIPLGWIRCSMILPLALHLSVRQARAWI
jgi:hypothetical protein